MQKKLPENLAARELAKPLVPDKDLDRVVELANEEFQQLHEDNISRYRLRLSEYRAWQALQKNTVGQEGRKS
jgi:hypothetical protein